MEKIKTDIFKDGKNPTWTNYQKLVSKIINNNLGDDNYNFLDFCFITELSQIHLPQSNYLKKNGLNDNIRKDSIDKRKDLFKQPFFQKFPIVIMACGHYPRDFDFDIEETFNIDFTEQKKQNDYWYNIHHNKDYKTNGKNKIVVHTRHVVNSYDSKENVERFFQKIAEECQQLYNFHCKLDSAQKRWDQSGKEIYEKLQTIPDFDKTE